MATPFIEMVHPDDRARVYGNYLRRLRGEAVEAFYKFRVVDTAGETRWLQISAVAIEWEGRPATLNFLTDVTEQVGLEANLAQTLAEREAILETTAVGIMFIQNGRIKWINDALERGMLGFDDGETIVLLDLMLEVRVGYRHCIRHFVLPPIAGLRPAPIRISFSRPLEDAP